MSSSSFYYKSTGKKQGIKPSIYTFNREGWKVSNNKVVLKIEELLQGEFVCYGYLKVTKWLNGQGFIINKKKVYRLMKENNITLGKRIKTTGSRSFVQHRTIKATKPFEYFSMDIKHLWVPGEKRQVYLLSIIDVYSRKIMNHKIQYSIKQNDVIKLISELLMEYPITAMRLRNDNGSQFIAHQVREFLKMMGVYQEFTHVATPEENAYIESFFKLLQTEVIERFEWDSFFQLQLLINRYIEFYNNERIHSAIGYMSPNQFLINNNQKKTVEKYNFVSNLN